MFQLKSLFKRKEKEKSINRVILDGEEMNNHHLFQLAMMQKLDFPRYYGMNLDSMWDCLTSDVEYPLELEWINFEKSKEYLGEEYVRKVVETFDELKLLEDFEYILK